MAHENSITVKRKGRFFNISTVVGGKSVGERAATKMFRAGKLKPLGGLTGAKGFATEQSAVARARGRSKQFGRQKGRRVR